MLERLREMFDLLDSRFTIKGLKSGTATWKMQREGMGEGAFRPSPGPLPTRLLVKLFEPRTSSFWVFMEAASHRHGRLNHWPLTIEPISSPSPLPLAWGLAQPGSHMKALGGYGAEISSFLIRLVSPPGN